MKYIFALLLLAFSFARAQNVGIGTAAPTSKLLIRGNGTTVATSALDVNNSANASMLFVRDDGNVGIGTTSPTSRLHVEGGQVLIHNALDLSRLRLNYDNTGAATNSSNQIAFENSANNTWIQYQGGPNLGYFGVAPDAMEWWWYPSGAPGPQCCHRRFAILPTAGPYVGTMTVVIDGTGQMFGNGWSQPSDSTLKEAVQRIASPTAKIKALNGYTYDYKESSGLDNGRSHSGVIAQEVARVMPEAVSASPQGDYLTVNYDALIPLLIEGMKEQQAQIDAQQQQLAQQAKLIEELGRRD